MVGSVSKVFKHFVGIAAECRARAIVRLVVRYGERASDGYEFPDFSTLVDFHEGVSIIETFVVHNLLCVEHRSTRNPVRCQGFHHVEFGARHAPRLDAFDDFVFVAVAGIGGVEVGVGEPILEAESLTRFFKIFRATLQDDVGIGVGVGFHL